MRSVNFSYAQIATQEFDKVFDGVHVFDNPKHYIDIAKIIEYLTSEDDLIVDFFAGSCTTAHASYYVNRRKHRNRNYICVKLQEPVNEKLNSGRMRLSLALKQ